jgi:phospholipase/carboxylesterase
MLAILFVLGLIYVTTSSSHTAATSSTELDFLDVNLTQLNTEASIAMESKNYREAVRKYLQILHHRPTDVTTLYNIARCYASLRKPDLAAKALSHALGAGLSNIELIDTDSAWNGIRTDTRFKPIIDEFNRVRAERGESLYAECKVYLRGRVRGPDNYDSTKSYPLIVVLHGNGGNPEGYMAIRDQMGAQNFIFAAPQGAYPRKLLDTNSPTYSWFYLTSDKEIWKMADPPVVEYILNVIGEVRRHYRVSNVYILGHSQGGALAYMTGITHPDLIRGIICFGAGNPKDYLVRNDLRNASSKLPVFIGHGWYDQSVAFEKAQETRQMLRSFDFNVTIKGFKGGHWLDRETLTEARQWIERIESNNLQPIQ